MFKPVRCSGVSGADFLFCPGAATWLAVLGWACAHRLSEIKHEMSTPWMKDEGMAAPVGGRKPDDITPRVRGLSRRRQGLCRAPCQCAMRPKTSNCPCVPIYTFPLATVGTENFVASPAAPVPLVGLLKSRLARF